MTWILALEGGGTRSQAVLVDEQGQVRGSAFSRDVNTNFTAFDQAQESVREAVRGVLSSAGISGKEVTWLVSALVGPRFGAETYGSLCPRAEYHYYGESQVVFARAGLYRPHGAALVAATGATAWAVRQDDGRQYACGGWGSLLGDEGSAYALGLGLLRASTRAFEGRLGPATRLPDVIAAHFGLNVSNYRHELVRLAYGKPLSRAEIAGLAPIATRLAAEGDETARRLVDETARDLADVALHAVRTLFGPQETFPVVAAGGMIAAGDVILAPLREALAREFPLARLLIGSEDPALALARLARFDLTHQESAC